MFIACFALTRLRPRPARPCARPARAEPARRRGALDPVSGRAAWGVLLVRGESRVFFGDWGVESFMIPCLAATSLKQTWKTFGWRLKSHV